ncbi:uncharacterized protein LOC110986722 [Acanthaster planci]|uniref:Uncharacterized protein LOC110986722 n=1 Tax=Acanthaster planci TaxID=133434 RepID=A0A8B7ZMH4_ACAPL|nr:uncharacterized protein LOC110986722 [Acanthaster planci]XP_022104551.1 uncharacterized protein LOC110986722 [Acanthaster planci]
MKAAVVMVCLVAVASAHLCLLNPHQRGSMKGINVKEADDCGLLVKPCGNRTQEKPGIQIKGGSPYTVVFQKNLNHFETFPNGTVTNGYFEISFWTSTECHILGKVDDGATPSLTLYSPVVTMPTGPIGVPAILQLTYVTNNAEVPMGGIFYQCTDIELF